MIKVVVQNKYIANFLIGLINNLSQVELLAMPSLAPSAPCKFELILILILYVYMIFMILNNLYNVL